MIKWHCNQKPLILGILSSGNLCLRNQFYSKLLETASTASDLKCLKIQVIWDHAPSNWTIWGWQKAVMMKFKHLFENVVIFWTQPQQPPYQPLRSSLFWGHWGLFLPVLDTRVIAKADLNHFMTFSETASDDLKMASEVKSNFLLSKEGWGHEKYCSWSFII